MGESNRRGHKLNEFIEQDQMVVSNIVLRFQKEGDTNWKHQTEEDIKLIIFLQDRHWNQIKLAGHPRADIDSDHKLDMVKYNILSELRDQSRSTGM